MMSQEIHGRLKAHFGDSIADYQAPEAGDPFILAKVEILHDICAFLKAGDELYFDSLRLQSGVDWGDHFSSVYHLYSYKYKHSLVLRVDLPRENPSVASVVDLWPIAEWFERETFDMFGISFEGHAGLRRILLPLDWEGYPLRKDYKQPREYHGVSND